MKQFFRHLAAICTASFIFVACRKESIEPDYPQPTDPPTTTTTTTTTNSRVAAVTTLLSEDFEAGTKTAYASAAITLSSGSWTLDEALIGTSTADLKNGAKSVRIRNTGTVANNFDIPGSATSITLDVTHGIYGTDGASNWQLWVAVNGGSYQQVGSTVTSTSTLQTASFTFTASSSFRVSIRKVSGGTNRINIDDIEISTDGGGSTPGDNDHLLMGNPSGAVTDIAVPNNYLMNETYYVESYNRDQGKANWVSWHLGSSDLGSTPRQDDFRSNTALPSGWYRVQSSSYSGSGFDRGHMCPSADRTSSVAANSSTFLMTNMIPQAPNNNQQTWANLENYERDLVNAGNELYVICGSYGSGGTGSNGGTTYTINNGKVTVPSNVWKVIVVLSNGNNDLGRVTATTRVIAINTPNVNSINSNWKNYRVSVDAIESATGYNLLSNLPASIQTAVEASVDNL